MKYVLFVAAIIVTLLTGRSIAADEPKTATPTVSEQNAPATGSASAENTSSPKEQTEDEHEKDIFTAGKPDAQKIFGLVLEHLRDTYELHFFSAKIPLPIIFIDAQGFHFFASLDALEHSGEYTIKGLHEIEDQKKASQFLKVTPFKRVDGKPMGTFWDFSITANVFWMLLAAILLILLALNAGKKARTNLVPHGAQNLVETLVVYVRDDIVAPNIEGSWRDRTLPYFVTVFLFILVMNILGLVPLSKTPTAAIAVTMALALCTFVLTQIAGIRAMGIKEYLKHFTGGMLDMDIPIAIKIPLILIMTPIEIIGLFTKPFALMIRLFANMTAGHIVIGALIGLAILFQSVIVGFSVSVPFALFIYLLELLVAFIQAYVFTTLSAVFVGMMAHEHHEEEHHAEPAAAH
ncbi:MAG TPA: F0F1 ATP synthase subunit A [Candidatus Kapabacteria bacterium]|nr:F0F1 ATP synthase subunit A [Candidatus Kapabacteria bacterium]